MTAARLNLPVIEKGATYRHTLVWKDSAGTPINMAGCTAKLQVREEVLATTVLLEMSTENGYLTITPALGQIDLYMTDEITKDLLTEGGVYDLEIYHQNGDVTRLCKGSLAFSDQVTRG